MANRPGVYSLQNGSLLIVSAAGIRSTTLFGPVINGDPNEVAERLRRLADFVERAGESTAPIMTPGVGQSEL